MVSFLLIYLFAGETNLFKSYVIIKTKLGKGLQKEVYQKYCRWKWQLLKYYFRLLLKYYFRLK